MLPENWEVKEIRGECLAVVNWLNCTSNSKTGKAQKKLAETVVGQRTVHLADETDEFAKDNRMADRQTGERTGGGKAG